MSTPDEATRSLAEAMEILAEIRHLSSIQEIAGMTLEQVELVQYGGKRYLVVGFGRSTRDTGPACTWYYVPGDESWAKLERTS